MGGSFDNEIDPTIVESNPESKEKPDGTQSWDSFVDTKSAYEIFQNKKMPEFVIITRELTEKAILSQKKLVQNLPDTPKGNVWKEIYPMYKDQESYRMWDVVTAYYIGYPSFFTSRNSFVKCILDGPSRLTTFLFSFYL
eukprot:TRINITY_DN8542_c0_g1_i1.p1 TRINITY_DN8542_c0_g1~~TRINITY_DN8542_c0_g1_i1.p1  ORF type:complete len:139 (-),score=29.15 TRINITY_DN8542_c0_g1_i1:130-546(-)